MSQLLQPYSLLASSNSSSTSIATKINRKYQTWSQSFHSHLAHFSCLNQGWAVIRNSTKPALGIGPHKGRCTIDRASHHNKIIMPDTIETQNGFRVYVSFSFSLSIFLMSAGSHWGKVLFDPRLQLVHVQKADHPQSVSHESHPKLDPHTHRCFKFQQRTKERERQSHICSWRFRKQHFCKVSFFLVCLLPCLLARQLVFFCFKLTLLGSVSPLFTQNTPCGVTIKSGSNLSK